MGMYSFTGGFHPTDDTFYSNPRFKAHARKVVEMLDATVNMIGPDLEPLADALKGLGKKHVAYGVLPAHYGIVGEALLQTLGAALGDRFTPKVKAGWGSIYRFVSSNMIDGADQQLRRLRERRQKRQDKKNALEVGNNNCDSTNLKPSNKRIPAEAKSMDAVERKRVISLVDEALEDCSQHSGRSEGTATTASTDFSEMDQGDYRRMVESVFMSWDIVKRIPNYAEVAGVMLFKKCVNVVFVNWVECNKLTALLLLNL